MNRQRLPAGDLLALVEAHRDFMSTALHQVAAGDRRWGLVIASSLRLLCCPTSGTPLLKELANERQVCLMIWGPEPLPRTPGATYAFALRFFVGSATFPEDAIITVRHYDLWRYLEERLWVVSGREICARQLVDQTANKDGAAHFVRRSGPESSALRAVAQFDAHGEVGTLQDRILFQLGHAIVELIDDLLGAVSTETTEANNS